MRLSYLSLASLLVTALGTASLVATAQTEDQANTASDRAPVLAELFTSQSCSSCPSAERLFNKLAETEGVVAIQWHVDYWDNLVHGRAGKWKDPYSSAANTKRQRAYNYALRGTGSVYTPQAVIGGVSETTGSRKRGIARMIAAAPPALANIDFSQNTNGYSINVSPKDDMDTTDAETMIVTLLKAEDTNIQGGENKGLSVISKNVAVDAQTLGDWTGSATTYQASVMPENYTCAVIVQEKNKGRVLGAAYCPA